MTEICWSAADWKTMCISTAVAGQYLSSSIDLSRIGRILTGTARSVVQMLTWKMEVELLEIKLLAAELERAALGNNLDGGTQVLKLGVLKVGNLHLNISGRQHVKRALHHVDGRLPGAC